MTKYKGTHLFLVADYMDELICYYSYKRMIENWYGRKALRFVIISI